MKFFWRSVLLSQTSECLCPCASLFGINLFFSSPLVGSCSQCWNRICCCWASDCNVLWEVKYACEHSDWEMGTWPNRHEELLWNKRRSSSVLSGGKSVTRKLKLLFFWVKFEPVYLRNGYSVILLLTEDQVASDWHTGPFVSKCMVWLGLLKGCACVCCGLQFFQEGILQKPDTHRRSAAWFSWLPTYYGKMWSKTCHVYACVFHLL